MQKRRPVATGWLQTTCVCKFFCVEEKRVVLFIFFFPLTTKKERKNAKKVKYSLLFVSRKKAILLYERCACFDSD